MLRQQEYPNWNFSVTLSYPLMGSQAEAQLARARLQRNQSLTRLRALEVQVAAEVTNAALTIQSNLKRVEAATAARELAQKRLEAEQPCRPTLRRGLTAAAMSEAASCSRRSPH